MSNIDLQIVNISRVFDGTIGQNISIVRHSLDDSIDIVDNDRRCVIIRLSADMVSAITDTLG